MFSPNSLTPEILNCIQATGNYATIGLFLGFSTFSAPPINPVSYSSDTLKAFLGSSLNKELILYVNFNETSTDAIKSYISNQLSPFLPYKDSIRKVWVRTNIDSDCPAVTSYINCQIFSPTTNLVSLNISIDAVKDLGFESGIYTNEGIWGVGFNITNSVSDGFASVPLLFDDTDYSDIELSYDGYSEPFGPWKTPAAKMSAYWYIDQTCCWPGQIVWTKTSSKSKNTNCEQIINDFDIIS